MIYNEERSYTQEDLLLFIAELRKQNQQLKSNSHQMKSTLEEIREYVNNHIHQETFTGYMDSYELKHLLQIIDKGVNNE